MNLPEAVAHVLNEQLAGIVHHSAGGVYVREQTLAAGKEVEKHVHTYDHLSYLAQGRALVEIDGVLGIVQGPAMLEVKAGKTHRIQAITDLTWLCIHAEAIADPETVKQE
jgi:quercetin dioxygenase-like cupin family protein